MYVLYAVIFTIRLWVILKTELRPEQHLKIFLTTGYALCAVLKKTNSSLKPNPGQPPITNSEQ